MVASVQRKKIHLSRHEKEQLIKKYVGSDFDLQGQRYEIMSRVIDYIDEGDNIMSFAEVGGDALAIWLPRVAVVLESGTFVVVGEVLSMASIILLPVGAMKALIDANHASERYYGMRAVAYTTTAWAFDDPIPHSSPARLHTIRQNFRGDAKLCSKTLSAFQQAWNNARQATLSKLNKIAAVDKKAGQLLYRAMGDGDRQTLTLRILKGFAKEASYQDRIWIELGYPIRYPN
jgi:hypothetical protein